MAAVPADEGRRRCVGQYVGLLVFAECGGLRRDDMQQLERQCEVVLASAVGQQAIVPDAMEAAGQHMQQESAHELLGRQRHGLVARASLGAVGLPSETRPALIHRKKSAVGDGHPVRIARQVGEQTAANGRFL